jgi:hypothetical protein
MEGPIMAKLTRRQVAAITSVIHALERGVAYIDQPDVSVCRKGGPATTTLHYTRPDGSTLFEVEKAYRSDLCAFHSALKLARGLLSEPSMEVA